jgi:glycosyltransferase involved in cell wall biosynthesis
LARKADVVHAHTFASALPAMVRWRRGRRPLVVTLHTSHFLMRAESPRWRRVFARVIDSADYLLATSEEILRVALGIHPHPRSEVMTNAVNTDRFAPGEGREAGGRFRIVVPRRLYPKNGVEYFVRAMPLIVAELDAEARIVGDGPERERLKSLVIELGISDRIEFLGARPNDEMPGLLRDADLAVVPSLMEATSIAALEAMACALPIAASQVGGLPEIIDEGVGALVEPKNPRALANAVVSLLRRPDRQELGREARRRVVANWSISRMVERHLEIYNGLLDEAKEKGSRR